VTAPLFPLGRVVATPGALEVLGEEARTDPTDLLARHHRGDWGELNAHDRSENTKSLKHGWRLLSSYPLGESGAKIWIITEADRSSTCLLLPDEY
jgi:hypothetical protein